MATERYAIIRKGNSWQVDHGGLLEGDYATKEAAFEAAAAAASNAIKVGLGIAISVPERASGETAVGGKP
jgi:hypothetical protein